jgi:hypothetical protein
MLLTCVEQYRNKGLSDRMQQGIQETAARNKKEPEQRLAEVEAIKEVCVVCKCA